jgi:threonine-phosphate decarboxylase
MNSHGGDIYRLARSLKIPERSIIDFSASINPLGISKKIKAELRRYLKYLNNYPDPECHRLTMHISRHLKIPEENIVCGNGSTELIYLIVRLIRPENVLIPVPTFSEYERAVTTSHECRHTQIRFLTLDETDNFRVKIRAFTQMMRGCQLAFLCNPNNPTAQQISRESILEIASIAREEGCYLVLDEAFIDFVPHETVVSHVTENPYLIVLRSMTKFYALSGLRLGFGILSSGLAEKLRDLKEPWTVNTLSQRAGVVAIKDRVYRRQTFEYLKNEKAFLERGLNRLGIKFFPSSINFYLIKHQSGAEIRESLKRKRILLRDCSNFRGLDSRFIRIAVKTHRENALLIKELGYLLRSDPD